MMLKLTISILSYNRPKELERCIKSLLPIPDNVNIQVFDDNSPKKEEILSVVRKFEDVRGFTFFRNIKNLGYDQNLFQSILQAHSDLVLLMGDDDMLEEGSLKILMNFIEKNEVNCGFLKFKNMENDSNIGYNRDFNKSKYFPKTSIISEGSFFYNSILFSGLIFRKSKIESQNSLFKKYFNSIYIQTALFTYLSITYGTFFIEGPTVIIGSDGENGFGLNDANGSINKDLSDRTTLQSNLAYHKRLLNIVREISSDFSLELEKVFIKEYKIRLFYMFYKTRIKSRIEAIQFFQSIDHNLFKKWSIYYIGMLIFIFIPKFLIELPIHFLSSILIRKRLKNINEK